jgi:NAD(P)-dependent dehydrogenase (short-subunit alcohol dehydrogenase family)
MTVAGKVAVVTGGAAGIGRATALRLAADGARVVVADIDAEGGDATVRRARDRGDEATFVRCDIADGAQVQALFAATDAAYGGLDILHLNAAHMGDFHAVVDTSEEAWDRSIRVTLSGAFLCAKYGLPRLIERGGGSLIATTSVGGSLAFEGMAAYCAAKGGLTMLIRSIALDYGAKGIRANAVAPGRVEPPSPGAASADRYSLVPAPWATPAEIAAVVAFLASDEATFINGSVITVDGGWSAHWARRTDRPMA